MSEVAMIVREKAQSRSLACRLDDGEKWAQEVESYWLARDSHVNSPNEQMFARWAAAFRSMRSDKLTDSQLSSLSYVIEELRRAGATTNCHHADVLEKLIK